MTEVKSKPVKLQYLRGYLADHALLIIHHLTIMNDNHNNAIQLYKEGYLDNDYIVNEVLKQINESNLVLVTGFIGVK